MSRNDSGQFVSNDEPEEENEEEEEDREPTVTDLKYIAEGKAEKLANEGFDSIESIAAAHAYELMVVKGIKEKTASMAVEDARSMLQVDGQRSLQWNSFKEEYEVQDPDQWECECGKSFRQKTVYDQHQDNCKEV